MKSSLCEPQNTLLLIVVLCSLHFQIHRKPTLQLYPKTLLLIILKSHFPDITRTYLLTTCKIHFLTTLKSYLLNISKIYFLIIFKTYSLIIRKTCIIAISNTYLSNAPEPYFITILKPTIKLYQGPSPSRYAIPHSWVYKTSFILETHSSLSVNTQLIRRIRISLPCNTGVFWKQRQHEIL